MNSEYPLQLEDAQKKLSLFRKHLDMLVQGVWESKNVNQQEVLAAVTELESLIEWVTQQPQLKVESELLLDKLQQLHTIRQNLQSPTAEIEELPEHAPPSEAADKTEICDKLQIYSRETLGNGTTNACSSSEEKESDVDLICLNSTLDENSNDVVEHSNATEESGFTSEISNFSENLSTNLNTEKLNESTNVSPVCSKKDEESKHVSFKDSEISGYRSVRNEITILETNEDDKTSEVITDSKSPNDPLGVCMYAIKNLYESLRTKENELLKLSVIQNDQKQIEALQEVVTDFHKEITNLNSQLQQSSKENAVLKEQVLELEEAENDARLAAQNFEQKLIFLQEKDSHSQAELHQLKQNLKKSAELLAEKETSEKELRSQVKYMEALVQKYEDQIKSLEAKPKQESETKSKGENAENTEVTVRCENRLYHEKGTQTYDPSLSSCSKFRELPEEDNTCMSVIMNENNEFLNKSKVDFCEDTADSKNSLINESSSPLKVSLSEEQMTRTNPSQTELLKRLQKLMEDDAELQQQLHKVDQINLAMWVKLQSLENDIGRCRRQNINASDGINELQEYSASVVESQTTVNCVIPAENVISLDQNEQSIQERLMKLEQINAAFENDLTSSEKLCEEKDTENGEWRQIEEMFRNDLKRLSNDRENLMDQVINLKKEKEELEQRVLLQQTELNTLKEKNELEISKIRAEQETMTVQLHQKVKQLLAKEKEHLKMITNLKSERNSSHDKSELERLKCSYIELQLELSNSRDEIRKLEEDFKFRLDECMKMHKVEETRLTLELEHLRKENINCDKMMNDLQLKQMELLNALKQQEENLNLARKNYENNMENTEVHRSVETELKHQLRQIEEGTVLATVALTEERMRVEKELQENINDLRAKEESYKEKISQLENNVIQLRQDLNMIVKDSELTKRENISSHDHNEKERLEPIEVNLLAFSKPESQSDAPSLTSSSYTQQIFSPVSPTVKSKEISKEKNTEVAAQINMTGESVDQLRAQVRQLQSQLERISDYEIADVSSVPSSDPINTFSMGIPKEDLDYAEVEECANVSREKASNSDKNDTPNFQTAFEEQIEHRNYATNDNASAEQENDESDYDELLPRPTNFHVVQQVGSDTLLVGWNYVNPSVLDGFEVHLNNEVHERIYIPDRTKALISGLDLRRSIRLSIYALSRYGQMSEPAVLEISSQETSAKYFEVDEDYKKDFQSAMAQQQRPYSMEW